MKNEEILCKKQQKEEKDNSDFQRLIRVCRNFFLLIFEGFSWTFYGYFAVTLRDFGQDFICGRRFPYFVHENLSSFDKN